MPRHIVRRGGSRRGHRTGPAPATEPGCFRVCCRERPLCRSAGADMRSWRWNRVRRGGTPRRAFPTALLLEVLLLSSRTGKGPCAATATVKPRKGVVLCCCCCCCRNLETGRVLLLLLLLSRPRQGLCAAAVAAVETRKPAVCCCCQQPSSVPGGGSALTPAFRCCGSSSTSTSAGTRPRRRRAG